ncbi:ras-like protein family member 11A-like isoform X1 [Colossoma macropomum]|uniref:ras-like protein family member 11A-like isoform X1 n=1 Tax=Colossoma macropomum TaxID=42526 RepID=UPI0018655B50|nr:ras-like protein family member 11A-like isoform X1 [Colossoma macropomum]
MRLIDQPGTMSSGSSNFLLVPIPEYPVLDCVPNKNVKIVVLGASNVGKTALIVRFLTKRFIGDYEANTVSSLSAGEINHALPLGHLQASDGLWRILVQTFGLQTKNAGVEIKRDDAEGLYCQEQINRSIYWADGYVLVFSITDLHSYRTIQPLYQHVRRIHPSGNIPIILVGNKSDLLRARQVPAHEGEALAAELGGPYFEASARENHEGVHAAFLHLCQEVSRALGGGNGEKRRGGLHLARPKSPNMQELKRRFRQVLSSKVKSATAL